MLELAHLYPVDPIEHPYDDELATHLACNLRELPGAVAEITTDILEPTATDVEELGTMRAVRDHLIDRIEGYHVQQELGRFMVGVAPTQADNLMRNVPQHHSVPSFAQGTV